VTAVNETARAIAQTINFDIGHEGASSGSTGV
jgi:hypothetical protein